MAVANPQIQKAAKIAKVDWRLLQLLLGQEGGTDAQGRFKTSPAGARGPGQLMPGTARRLEQTYKIDTSTFFGNLLGGAYYLKEQLRRFKRVDLALAAYNAGPGAVKKYGGIPPYAETQKYVKNIMDRYRQMSGGKIPSSETPPLDPQGGPGLSSFHPAPPGVDYKRQVLKQGLKALASGTYSPTVALRELNEASQAAKAAAAQMPSTSADISEALPNVSLTKQVKNPSRWVKVPKPAGQWPAPGPEIMGFAAQIAKMRGRPISAWDTSTHSRMTVNGNVSAHTTGDAMDIPAAGAELLRLGRLALIAAGMPRREAMKQRGGLYNIGGRQIIFNTNVGGNHRDHLHIANRRH